MTDTMTAFIILAVFMALIYIVIIISEKWHIHKYIILAGTVFLILLVFICTDFFIKEKHNTGSAGAVIESSVTEGDD